MGNLGTHIRDSRRFCLAASVSVLLFLTISSLTIFPITRSVDPVDATAGVSNPSLTSLSLSSGHSTASVTATAVNGSGTFVSSDSNDVAAFAVNTNNYTGYELSIVGSDDTGDLTTATVGEETPDSISSITSITSTSDFATTGSLNNKWGFAPSKYVSNNTVIDNTGVNQVFLPAPTTTPITLDKTSVANAIDNEYTLALGVRVDYTTPSGAYSNTFTLIALANPTPYNVTFNQNTADTVANMPTGLGSSTSATSITIPNTTPSRDNYTFAGWCDRKDSINTCPSGGHTFQPGTSYGIDQTIDNTNITLYALWQPNYYMQDVAIWGHNLAIGDSVQAVDRRDGKVYWVTKEETDLANPRAEVDTTTGKAYQIWMTQNLSYNLDSNTTLTPIDSDVSTSWTPLRSTVTDIDDWQDDNTSLYSYFDGDKYYYTSASQDNDILYDSMGACVGAGHSSEECAHYSAGVYYNWTAAIASNATPSYSTFENATDSVCPAGWRLPYGNTGWGGWADFDYLLNQNDVIDGHTNASGQYIVFNDGGLDKFRSEPLWIVRAGRIDGRRIEGTKYIGQRESSYYWTSTYSSDQHNDNGTLVDGSFNLGVNPSQVYSSHQNFVRHGFSVRCIARNTMQESNSDDVLAFTDHTVGGTTKLSDTRDGKTYTVGAIPDGRIWMTSDLDLAGGTTLTSADSNVATDYTLPESSYNGFNDNTEPFVYNSNSTVCGENSPCYSYYNYVAATAGSNPNSGDAEYDICPKGWRLPTRNEYLRLFGIYTTLGALTSAPWSGNLGGEMWSEGHEYGGEDLNYWTSTASGEYVAYTAYATEGGLIGSEYLTSKLFGDPVRCVQKGSISDIATMQGFSSLGSDDRQDAIDSMRTDFQYDLKDVRDNKMYTVAKMSDGTVWMTENLDIAGGTTLTPATSNVSSNYTLPASSSSGFSDNATAYVYNTGRTACIDTISCYSYYSFVAAAAGTNPSEGEVKYDICPKGWRLPSNEEYNGLLSIYGTDADLIGGSWSGIHSGDFLNSSFAKDSGSYWSSTAYNANMAYRFLFSTSGVSEAIYYKSVGRAIRCVLDNTTIDNLSTMQEFDNLTPIQQKNMLESFDIGRQYSVQDARDNQQYTITKLDGGTVWMTKSLELAGSTPLYSDTSNVPDGYPTSGGVSFYTLPASSVNGFNDNTVANVYNTGSTNCGNNSPCYSYYNYLSATAGTNPSEGDARYDICPKGWRLPVEHEYWSMIGGGSYFETDLTSTAWRGVYSGEFSNGQYRNQASFADLYGSFMTATAHDATQSYALSSSIQNSAYETYVGYSGKMNGMHVRCVLDISLQDATPDLLSVIIPDAITANDFYDYIFYLSKEFTITLSDERDGEKYPVTRLADGNMWIAENLRLGGASTINLTPDDTNISLSYTLPASVSTGFNSYNIAQLNSSRKNIMEKTEDSSTNVYIYQRIGNYYNYCAASAGTYCLPEGSGSGNATEDICPKGWRLPTGGDGGEYETLFTSYNGNSATLQVVLQLVKSGLYSGSNVESVGTWGVYWSSTNYSDNHMYYLSLGSSGVSPIDHYSRNRGQSIRCIKSY